MTKSIVIYGIFIGNCILIISNLVISQFLCTPANSSGVALEKVSGLDGVKVGQIAAGAEHSAVVTGKFCWLCLCTHLCLFPLLNHFLSVSILLQRMEQ